MGVKTIFMAYLLWLGGGFFGLHHLYLGRDRQAFLWWMTAGGYFGLGWIRDIWWIPTYVKDANEDKEYMNQLITRMRQTVRPPFCITRVVGQLLVGDLLGFLTLNAIPKDYIGEKFLPLAAIVVPCAVAIGVHTVGNVGRYRGDLLPVTAVAYLTYPAYFWQSNPVLMTVLACTLAFNGPVVEWKKTVEKPKSVRSRMMILSSCAILYLSLWACFIHFSCTITFEDQGPIKCEDAIRDVFTSTFCQHVIELLKDIYNTVKNSGWTALWLRIKSGLISDEEREAFHLLGLNYSASESEIKSRYRQLSRQWHPDKLKEPVQKEIAQKNFIKIQAAYQLLSKKKSQRRAQNMKS